MPVIIVPDDYTDIQSAVYSALPGEEIYVRNGVYNEQVVIEDKNNISIIAAGNNVVLDGSGLTPRSIGFYLIGVSKIKIRGFKIKGFDKGIIVDGLSDSVDIASVTIKDISDDGIKIHANNCTFTNNSIFRCKDDAVKITGSNCTIINNYVDNNGEEGIEIKGNNNIIRRNAAINNLGIGIEMSGNDNAASENITVNNYKYDILNSGTNNTSIKNTFDSYSENA